MIHTQANLFIFLNNNNHLYLQSLINGNIRNWRRTATINLAFIDRDSIMRGKGLSLLIWYHQQVNTGEVVRSLLASHCLYHSQNCCGALKLRVGSQQVFSSARVSSTGYNQPYQRLQRFLFCWRKVSNPKPGQYAYLHMSNI